MIPPPSAAFQPRIGCRRLAFAGGLVLSLAWLAFAGHAEFVSGAEAGDSVAPHTELRESRPPADSAVQGPVSEVLLIFTTDVQADLSSITVRGWDGEPRPAGPVGHPSAAARDRLVVRFDTPLRSGSHEVEWRTVSPDGHIVEGTFGFQVQPPPAAEPVAPPPRAEPPAPDVVTPPPPQVLPDPGLVPAGTAQRWLHLLATILILGVVAFRFGVLGRGEGRSGLEGITSASGRGLTRVAWAGTAVLLVTLGTRLHRFLTDLGGGEEVAWAFLPVVLFRHGWGAGWWLHLAAVILAATGLVLIRRPGAEGRGWSILAGAAALLPLVPALQGHAMGADSRVFNVPIMYVHVGAVGVWLGGLLMLVLVGLPAVKRVGAAGGAIPPLARLVNAFSRMALPTVALIVLSGATTAFLLGPGLAGVFGSTWGRTLLLKLAVLAGAFTLGFYNWRRVRPALAENADPSTLRIPAMVEGVLGIIVLLITAALVATPLP